LLEVQAFQACSLLVVIASDLGLGGCHLAYLVLVATCDPFGHSPHVDHHLPFPPSWL